jgi:hypothetical protein
MRTFPLILFLVLLSTFASAEIYKWVDENGQVKFSDKPQYSRDDYYIPKTAISSYERYNSRKGSDGKATDQSNVKSSANRKKTKELERAEELHTEAWRSSQEEAPRRDKRLNAGIPSSQRGSKPFAKTQAQHDMRTNYDGYGSEQSRYQNAIIMKTHNSILKGGNMEYWNGLDEYYYKGQHRGKASRSRW